MRTFEEIIGPEDKNSNTLLIDKVKLLENEVEELKSKIEQMEKDFYNKKSKTKKVKEVANPGPSKVGAEVEGEE